MCYYDALFFSGCGRTKRKSDSPLEPCVVAQVYSRECAEALCGPHPERRPTECFGLACMECLSKPSGSEKASKKSKKRKRSKKSKK